MRRISFVIGSLGKRAVCLVWMLVPLLGYQPLTLKQSLCFNCANFAHLKKNCQMSHFQLGCSDIRLNPSTQEAEIGGSLSSVILSPAWST